MSSAEIAYHALKESILERAFAPGERIKESALAVQLGLSRTPLREAFRRLVSEGWLEQITNQGVRVVKWTQADVEDIFDVRMLLEPHATGCAARNIQPAQIDLLKKYADQVEEYSIEKNEISVAKRAQANSCFHNLLLEVAGNQRITAILNNLVELPLVSWTFRGFSDAEAKRSTAHHFEIIEAIRANDAQWAEAVMRAHILAARHVVVNRLSIVEKK